MANLVDRYKNLLNPVKKGLSNLFNQEPVSPLPSNQSQPSTLQKVGTEVRGFGRALFDEAKDFQQSFTKEIKSRPGYYAPMMFGRQASPALDLVEKYSRKLTGYNPEQPGLSDAYNITKGLSVPLASPAVLAGGAAIGSGIKAAGNLLTGKKYYEDLGAGAARGLTSGAFYNTLGAVNPIARYFEPGGRNLGLFGRTAARAGFNAIREGVEGVVEGALRPLNEGETRLRAIGSEAAYGAAFGGILAPFEEVAQSIRNYRKYGASSVVTNAAGKKINAQTGKFIKELKTAAKAVEKKVKGLPMSEAFANLPSKSFVQVAPNKLVLNDGSGSLYNGLEVSVDNRGNVLKVSFDNIDVLKNKLKGLFSDQTGSINNKGSKFFEDPSKLFSTDRITESDIDRTKLTGVLGSKTNKEVVEHFSKSGGVPRSLLKEAPAIARDTGVKSVNIIDYVRTPDRVLDKLGLGGYAKKIRLKYDDYLADLPKEIDKVNQWYQQVDGNPDSSRRIFRYLDGKKNVPLNDTEKKVATEMKGYLEDWANKLRLPQDKRIASYITHIFEKDFIQKEFDEDLAKIIENKLPGEVYDPFLQKRLGQQGYVEDVFRALDAYVKRATRKFHMDQALEPLRNKVGKEAEGSSLDLESWKYVKNYIDRVNMRPTNIDNLIDKFVKNSSVGYKLGQRPVTATTKKLRQMVYRGTLGLNLGSALKNLTQGVNTFAEVGGKSTIKGYMDAFKALSLKDSELDNVLRDSFIQDRSISVKKKLIEKMDKGLFIFFEGAEKINRASAYYAGKDYALSKGFSEEEAIQFAKDTVRKTQFTFGSVDTPALLQSDLAKTLLQYQSFNFKNAEFLGEMLQHKEWKKLMRWVGANVVIFSAFGDLLGMDGILDAIPFGGVLEGETKIGETPITKTLADIGKVAADAPNEYGQPMDLQDKATLLGKDALAFIPAGSQIKKSLEGIKAYSQGASTTKKGNVRYLIEKDTSNLLRTSLLGQYKAKEAKEYFDRDGRPLGEQASKLLLQSSNKARDYKAIVNKNKADAEERKLKDELLSKGSGNRLTSDKFYYFDNGSVKTLNLSFSEKPPKLTNDKDLNKKILSDYKYKLSSRQGDLIKLLEQGVISESQAVTEFKQLEEAKKVISNYSNKPKKIKIPKIPPIKIPKAKIVNTSRKVKQLRRRKSKKYSLKKLKKLTASS